VSIGFEHTARRAHGNMTVSDPLAGLTEFDTRRCPHCGGHFLVGKGKLAHAKTVLGDAAKPRIYCVKCDRLTCGRACCDPSIVGCIPVEAQLEHAEGRHTLYNDLIMDSPIKIGS
jgi:hypothetical protein